MEQSIDINSPKERTARAMSNIVDYINGEGKWFSSRNKTAVLSQVMDVQSENANLQADLERTNRDFNALRVAYATDTERLKAFVARVAEVTDFEDVEYFKGLVLAAETLLASLSGKPEGGRDGG